MTSSKNLILITASTGIFFEALDIAIINLACISGFGIAICFTSLVILSVQGTPVQHQAIVSSVATTSYFFGAGLGLSLAIKLPLISEFVTVVLSIFASVGIDCLLIIQNQSQLENNSVV